MAATKTNAASKANSKSKASANGKASKATKRNSKVTPEIREAAKAKELTPIGYVVLSALNNAGADGLTYRGIEAKTGYYSVLTAVLRAKAGNFRGAEGLDHEASLGARGLVKEEMRDVEGRDTLTFVITAKGRKLLAK